MKPLHKRFPFLGLIASMLFLCTQIRGQDAWRVQTIAGDGESGYRGDGGPASEARINNPYGLTMGPENALYFCDMDNHVIRRIDRSGVIQTVAGCGMAGLSGEGGLATEAKMYQPYEVRFDRAGNLFVVEMPNHVIRRVDRITGIITTVAGTGQPGYTGDGALAVKGQLFRPHSIQFDASGNLIVCDIGNHRLRSIGHLDGMITTLSGNGKPLITPDGASIQNAPLNGPRAIDFAPSGDAWLALREGNAVYRLDHKQERWHHVAGTGAKGFTGHNGDARVATLSGPKGISVDPTGNLWLADTESHSVRMIESESGIIRLVVGNGSRGDGPDGEASRCQLARPHGIFAAEGGVIYVGDSENHRIRKITSLR